MSMLPITVNGRKYRTVGLIKKGSFGSTHRAVPDDFPEDSPQQLVLRELTPESLSNSEYLQKTKNLMSLSHRNVLSILDAGPMEETEYVVLPAGYVLITEYCSGGNLQQFLEDGMCWTLMAEYFSQLLESLSYLHANGIVHANITTQAILLKDQHATAVYRTAVLTDTDAHFRRTHKTKNFPENQKSSLRQNYRSPEMSAKNSDEKGKITFKTDVWSLGCILHQMAFGCTTITPAGILQGLKRPPALSASLSEFFRPRGYRLWLESEEKKGWKGNCTREGREISVHPPTCNHLQEILEKCFAYDPETRPGTADLLQSMFCKNRPPMHNFLDSSRLAEFAVSCRFFPLNYEYDSITVWHVKQGHRNFLALEPEDNLSVSEPLQPFFDTDLLTTFKLSHNPVPVNLNLYCNDQPLVVPRKLSVWMDLIASLTVYNVPCFRTDALLDVSLPHLTYLCMAGCSDVVIARSSLRNLIRLKVLQLHYCSISYLERNFLKEPPTVGHFAIYPVYPADKCRLDNQHGTTGSDEYSWVTSFLTDRNLTTEKASLPWGSANGQIYSSGPLPATETEAIKHTLECPDCSKRGYENRHKMKYNNVSLSETVHKLKVVQEL